MRQNEIVSDEQKLIWWNNHASHWNANLPRMRLMYDECDDEDIRFKWTLIKQEIEMFMQIAKYVSISDIDWLSDRRGFTQAQKDFLIDLVDATGISDNTITEYLNLRKLK